MTPTTESKHGFFVWTKRGKAPKFHHMTLESAQTEAGRLAAMNPGAKFIVMQAVSKHSVPSFPSGGTEAGASVSTLAPAGLPR